MQFVCCGARPNKGYQAGLGKVPWKGASLQIGKVPPLERCLLAKSTSNLSSMQGRTLSESKANFSLKGGG